MNPTGVVIAQLGTPAAPTAAALRPYLKQFLSDLRVIDYHPLLWQPILRGMILRTRPRKSAQLYARIWTEAGSPLMVFSQRQVDGVQQRLGESFRVLLGMTYGEPSIARALRDLEVRRHHARHRAADVPAVFLDDHRFSLRRGLSGCRRPPERT